MKKILIGSLLIITTFWGTNLPDDEQQKILKEIVKKYGETAIAAVEEKTRNKEKIDSCQKYLDKADKYIDYAEKKVKDRVEKDDSYLGGVREGMEISTLSIALMKRYEICLSKKVQ